METVDSSVLADIIDYGTWKYGHDQAATYFAIKKMVSKISAAIGAALSLAIAGWYGFNPVNSVNSNEAIQGLYLAIAWLPGPFILIALGIMSKLPINAYRYKVICRRLDARRIQAVTAK